LDLIPGPLPVPTPLFTKIDDTLAGQLGELLAQRVMEARNRESTVEQVSIEEFCRMDIRTGVIRAVEAVPKSKKLLRLEVDIGGEVRQIVGGIAQFYNASDLLGKTVVVLVNLKPAKIFGIESYGMILAAGDAASLLVPLNQVKPGTKIR
jgi:methionyl-tRNA synthetase